MAIEQVSDDAAAFGRLCVETLNCELIDDLGVQPPSGGCVLKHTRHRLFVQADIAAAFGRLCVETLSMFSLLCALIRSRLRAAVC